MRKKYNFKFQLIFVIPKSWDWDATIGESNRDLGICDPAFAIPNWYIIFIIQPEQNNYFHYRFTTGTSKM